MLPIAEMGLLPTLELIHDPEKAGPMPENLWMQLTRQRIVARDLDVMTEE